MKKHIVILICFAMIFSLAACGGEKKDEGTAAAVAENSLELLKKVWESYTDQEKFPCAGGDFNEANASTEGPGNYSIEDAESLNVNLGLPTDLVGKIKDAASLMHMMNANTFTCGAFHFADAEAAADSVKAIRDNIQARQWMCGFPDKLIIITVGDYVVSAFGEISLIDNFKTKFMASYESASVVIEEAVQ